MPPAGHLPTEKPSLRDTHSGQPQSPLHRRHGEPARPLLSPWKVEGPLCGHQRCGQRQSHHTCTSRHRAFSEALLIQFWFNTSPRSSQAGKSWVPSLCPYKSRALQPVGPPTTTQEGGHGDNRAEQGANPGHTQLSHEQKPRQPLPRSLQLLTLRWGTWGCRDTDHAQTRGHEGPTTQHTPTRRPSKKVH